MKSLCLMNTYVSGQILDPEEVRVHNSALSSEDV